MVDDVAGGHGDWAMEMGDGVWREGLFAVHRGDELLISLVANELKRVRGKRNSRGDHAETCKGGRKEGGVCFC
jgi:hypothetical protein